MDKRRLSRFIFMPVAPVGVINARLVSVHHHWKKLPPHLLTPPIRFPTNETYTLVQHTREPTLKRIDDENFAPRDNLIIPAIYKLSWNFSLETSFVREELKSEQKGRRVSDARGFFFSVCSLVRFTNSDSSTKSKDKIIIVFISIN